MLPIPRRQPRSPHPHWRYSYAHGGFGLIFPLLATAGFWFGDLPAAAAQSHRSQLASEALVQGQQAVERAAWDEAEVYFQRARFAEPLDPRPLLQLAHLHDRAGNDLTAIGYYRAFLAAMPQSPLSEEVVERIAALDAAAEKRASELFDLAYLAMQAMPDNERFAHDADRDPIPWYARFAALCGASNGNGELRFAELLREAEEGPRAEMLLNFALGRMYVDDYVGALRCLEQIDSRVVRWKGYVALASDALDRREGEQVDFVIDQARRVSVARQESANDQDVRQGENVFRLIAATARVRGGQSREAIRSLHKLTEVPTADTAVLWLVDMERVAALQLAYELALVPAATESFSILGRAQKLLDVQQRLLATRRDPNGLLGVGDPAGFQVSMEHAGLTRSIVRQFVLDALETADWSSAERFALGLDEETYCERLLERAQLLTRLGRRDDVRATVEQFQRQLTKLPEASRLEFQRSFRRSIEFPEVTIEKAHEVARLDDPPDMRDDRLVAALASRQIREGNWQEALRTAERLRYESERGACQVEAVVALAARGDIPAARQVAEKIGHLTSRQRAEVVLLAASAHDPARVVAVDLLGPERAWNGPDLSIVTHDIVTLLRDRGELQAAACVNLQQTDSVTAARCAGQIARAQLERGESTAADSTVRQFVEGIYPESLEPYRALAEELAVGADTLGLRTVASRATAVFRHRVHRRDLRQLALMQLWAGDAAGAAQTRAAADATTLAGPRQAPACTRFPQFWLNTLARVESRTLSGAPQAGMFGFDSRPDPAYANVPQRVDDQKRILTQLSSIEQSPEQAFHRLCGLAAKTLSGIYDLRRAGGAIAGDEQNSRPFR